MKLDRDGLRKLAERASPGPWTETDQKPTYRVADIPPCPGLSKTEIRYVAASSTHLSTTWDDARFIAAAREAIPTLLAVLDECEKALEAAVCPNCDDRLCMSCVLREEHQVCANDCPLCQLEDDAGALRRQALSLIRGESSIPQEAG